MPRNVRNFWVEGHRDDGVPVKGWGPVGSDKGFSLTVLVREKGSISDKALRIRGYVLGDGTLRLEAHALGVDVPAPTLTLKTVR